MAYEITRLFQFLNLLQLRFVFFVVFLRIQIGVTLQRSAKDTHCQRLQITQVVQCHRLGFLWHRHTLENPCRELRPCQILLHITQPIDTTPTAPAFNRAAQEVHLLGNRIVVRTHQLEAADGQLTSFWQVTINLQQRIQGCDIVKCLGTCYTSGTTVSRLAVIPMQVLPRFQLPANDTEQVVTIQLAVLSLDNERLISIRLHRCQSLRVSHCAGSILLALRFPVVSQLPVFLVYFGKHHIIDSLQGQVLDVPLLLFQPVNGRWQRVWGNLCL